MLKILEERTPWSKTLLLTLLLAGCGGTNTPTVDSRVEQNDTPSSPITDDDSTEESALFPPEGPVIDPVSTREEIASRADSLLTEYRTFMRGFIPQMNEVYQTVSSGLPSSDIPNVLANDIEFVNTVNNSCAPLFDSAGVITGMSNCNNRFASFALRHPSYANVQILVVDYLPTVEFNRGDETAIYIMEGRYTDIGSNFIPEDVVHIVTEKHMISTVAELNPPMVMLGYPAFSLDRQNCLVYLSPTRLPEDSLEVNRCSEMYKDMLQVLQRLNRRD